MTTTEPEGGRCVTRTCKECRATVRGEECEQPLRHNSGCSGRGPFLEARVTGGAGLQQDESTWEVDHDGGLQKAMRRSGLARTLARDWLAAETRYHGIVMEEARHVAGLLEQLRHEPEEARRQAVIDDALAVLRGIEQGCETVLTTAPLQVQSRPVRVSEAEAQAEGWA